MNFSKIMSVQTRDEVVQQGQDVWLHWIDAAPEQVTTRASHVWEDVVRFPDYYSLNEPEFKIKEDGNTIYEYQEGFENYE